VISKRDKARLRNERIEAERETLPVVPPTLHGCMPLRGDFDVEWDNDAEAILADMEFGPVRV
jgi:hypothetical protein